MIWVLKSLLQFQTAAFFSPEVGVNTLYNFEQLKQTKALLFQIFVELQQLFAHLKSRCAALVKKM